MHNQEVGSNAENYFISRLQELDITEYEYVDDWYDFEVLGQKIEIKSCRLTHKAKDNRLKKSTSTYRVGRFDFTKEENREKQYDEDIWICFIIRQGKEHLIMGFVKARKLNKKRRISIHKLRNLKLISFDDWIEKYKK